MYFYEVWVRSHRYQNSAALTYQSADKLTPGTIVTVPLQREQALAIVAGPIGKPLFKCKPITSVSSLPPLPDSCLMLFKWLQGYYPAPIGPLTQLFLPTSLPSKPSDQTTSDNKTLKALDLNDEQLAAIKQMTGEGTYILHGRTGSGKTRVYAALAVQALKIRRSALILSPEISLTPQLAESLEQLIGQDVVVFHSKLTAKQRSERWVHILTSTRPLVIIGPRSALFLPVASIGIIVLDEAHEPAYKQEQQPYYYAPRVASQLAALHGAQLVFGSATPTVSEYYIAEQKARPIIRLDHLATGPSTPAQQLVVDLKDRSLFSSGSAHLSNPLVTAIRQALASGEQTMLYLNRRGTARLTLCQNCGWQALCPHCDLPLAYHGDSHRLICHTCGHSEASPSSCPVCNHTDIVFKSAGTKAIMDEVARLFPEARLQRFDTDNKKAERLEQHFKAVQRGDVDILVGTQLLAKGLDLPRLSTLGVILADSSLAIPDFTAQERTYQLVQQVVGRIGRGHTASATAIIQTYDPNNPTLKAALSGDWQSFYSHEIAERRQFNFPPFCHLLKLSCKRASAASAEKAAKLFADQLRHKYQTVLTVDGPAPAFHERAGNKYEWQLVLKSRQRSVLLDAVRSLPTSGWTYDIDPINLL